MLKFVATATLAVLVVVGGYQSYKILNTMSNDIDPLAPLKVDTLSLGKATFKVDHPFGKDGGRISFEGTLVGKTHRPQIKVVVYDPETEQRSKPVLRQTAEAMLQSLPHGVIIAPDSNGIYQLPNIDRVEYEPAPFLARFAAATPTR